MNSASTDKRPWVPYRWWMLIGALFVVQAALIAWATDRRPIMSASAMAFSIVHLGAAETPVLAMQNDPALLALPSRVGFSGEAWLQSPPMTNAPAEWTEPPRFLAFDPAALGALFEEVVRTNVLSAVTVADKSEPAESAGDFYLAVDLMPSQTGLRVEGGLSARKLAGIPILGSITAMNNVTNSQVEIVVDRKGRVFSAALISQSSAAPPDQKAADQTALSLAKTVRFEPGKLARTSLRPGLEDVFETGVLVFQWHLEAPPAH